MNKQILMAAVEEMQKEINALQFAINKKKQAINAMYDSMGEQPPYEIEGESPISLTIRPDQFYGKGFATAASAYLKIKKQACTAQEIMDGLLKGGFDFPWKDDDLLRNVAISLAKNTQVFHKLPNGTFGLLEWYPDLKKKKSAKQDDPLKKGSTTPEGGSTADDTAADNASK